MAAPVMNSADSTGDGGMVTLGAVAARIRRYLQDTPRQSLPITYQALARVLGLSPPNMIHQVTESLEHLMREDAVEGRPFIAAFVISRAGGGLPARGFFECATQLGRYDGSSAGSETRTFHSREFIAAMNFWKEARDHKSERITLREIRLDERLTAPAAERNKEPILAVLKRVLPENGVVLEIASGTGQHVLHFAQALPNLTWQPSDPDLEARSSIAAWIAHEGVTNIRAPLDLDVRSDAWPIQRADAVICINMIHISPWTATLHLMAGSGRLLSTGGIVFLYGPFRRSGQHTAPSNEAFDRQLRRQDPELGVRDLEAVVTAAEQNGLVLDDATEMPANNLSVVFRRT